MCKVCTVYNWTEAYRDWMQSEIDSMIEDVQDLIAVLEETEESTDDSEQ